MPKVLSNKAEDVREAVRVSYYARIGQKHHEAICISHPANATDRQIRFAYYIQTGKRLPLNVTAQMPNGGL